MIVFGELDDGAIVAEGVIEVDPDLIERTHHMHMRGMPLQMRSQEGEPYMMGTTDPRFVQ